MTDGIDEGRERWRLWEERQKASLLAIEGGPELIAYFGFVPSFHDAEIVRLDLRREGPSLIEVLTWKSDKYADPCIVEMKIGRVIDLMLEGFSAQNVVFGIGLTTSAPVRQDRVRHYFPTGRMEDEVEIALEDTYGISGTIRCLDIALTVRTVRNDLSR